MGFKKNNYNRGFTLVEAMFSVTIFLMLMMLIAGSMINGLDLWQIAVCRSELQTQAQRAMNEMIKELRGATSTVGAFPPDADVLGVPPNNDAIVFYLPVDIDGDGTIIDALTGDTEWDLVNPVQYGYDLIKHQLIKLHNGNQRVLANYVTRVQFDDQTTEASLNRDEIKITFELKRATSRQRTITVFLVAKVKLRN